MATYVTDDARSGRAARRRPGTVLPLLAVSLVALLGFLALSIDLGMLMLSKVQAQDAADLAALSAARALNATSTNYGQGTATSTAQAALSYNSIIGVTIQPTTQLQLSYGTYDYNQSTQTFAANFPGTANVPTSAVSSIFTTNPPSTAFAGVFGWSALPSVTAYATAVHRPRDVALVMDMSGSMRLGTCLGFDFATSTRTTNNADTNVPQFGHYNTIYSTALTYSTASSRESATDNYTIYTTNTTATTSQYPFTYVNSFYQQNAYATPTIRAFDSYSSPDGGVTWTAPTTQYPQLPPSSYVTTPGGDVPLFKSGSTSTYAQTTSNVLGGTTSFNFNWELDGYSNYTNGSLNASTLDSKNSVTYPANSFNGYTEGPSYWGKTFFIWPPDPRQPLGTSTTSTNNTTIQTWLEQIGYVYTSTSTTTSTSDKNPGSGGTTTTSSGNPPTNTTVTTSVTSMTTGSGTKKTTTYTTTTTTTTSGLGYTNGTPADAKLMGIYSSTTQSGSHAWPWASGDTGAGTTSGTLSYYLTNTPVMDTNGTTALTTSSTTFARIMRLYGWSYLMDNTGSTAADWRVRFFGTNNNNVLFTSSGLATPGSKTYTINYTNILSWINSWYTGSGNNNPFPTQMRAGHIKYYGSIPSSITVSWSGSTPTYGSTDQQFWKEFIDYCLGFWQTGANTYQDVSAMAGYGSDNTSWAGTSLSSPPSSGLNAQSMSYTDSPPRPLLRYWFGPINMVDYLHNMNMSETGVTNFTIKTPGDAYEAPLYPAKAAFFGAITTMETNHPNDWFTTMCYSNPRTSKTSGGMYNNVHCPLGTNYTYATNALYFPSLTLNNDGTDNGTEVTPYDADTQTNLIPSASFQDTPRGNGDTCFDMALMMAYNQFVATPSTDTTLRTFVTTTPITFPTNGMAGGMGRKGAQKVVIFETDGIANCQAGINGSATAPTQSQMTTASGYLPARYYPIRYNMNSPTQSGTGWPTINETTLAASDVLSNIQTYITQMVSDFGTQRNPFRLYGVGFGPVFASSAPDYATATSLLQSMQYWAGTQASASTALPSDQIIFGSGTTMITNMTACFTSILENGIQIALIQ